MKLTQDKSRNIITITWLAFFAVNLLSILYLNFDNWIEKEDLIKGLKAISLAYGGYLGAIITFYLAKKGEKKKGTLTGKNPSETSEFKKSSFYIGFFCSFIWNMMITLFILPLTFGIGYFENSLEILSDITSTFSWLVGAAIGFFFAKNS